MRVADPSVIRVASIGNISRRQSKIEFYEIWQTEILFILHFSHRNRQINFEQGSFNLSHNQILMKVISKKFQKLFVTVPFSFFFFFLMRATNCKLCANV